MPRLNRGRPGHKRPKDYVQTTVLLTPEQDATLDREADAMGITRSALVRLAIEAWAADGSLSARSPNSSDSDSE